MKKLLSVLLLFVSMSLFGQGLPARLHIPQEYENYKANKLSSHIRNIGGVSYVEKTYDIDRDGIKDVSEIYEITGYDETMNMVFSPDYPMLYIFDINGNHHEDSGEPLMDAAMDGLNGNETWYNPDSKPAPAA